MQEIGDILLWVVDEIMVQLKVELDKGIIAASLKFLGGSEKTSYTVSHSCSMLIMSLRR